MTKNKQTHEKKCAVHEASLKKHPTLLIQNQNIGHNFVHPVQFTNQPMRKKCQEQKKWGQPRQELPPHPKELYITACPPAHCYFLYRFIREEL